jgi:hypothetical protein
MGVKARQKDGKWYVFINYHGQRKAKCVGDSKRAADEVKRKLEAKLTLIWPGHCIPFVHTR